MTTQPDTGAPGGTTADPAGGGQPAQLSAAELEKLRGLIGQAHTGAQQHTADRLDTGSTVADQVAAELKKIKDAEAAEAAEAGRKADMDGVKTDLAAVKAKMAEPAPTPPLRRITKFMFGADK